MKWFLYGYPSALGIFVLSVICYEAGLTRGLKAADWASWVQAFASVAAIIWASRSTVRAVKSQDIHERIRQVEADALRRTNVGRSVLVLLEKSDKHAAQVEESVQTAGGIIALSVGLAPDGPLILESLAVALGSIPIVDMPNPEFVDASVHAQIALRSIRIMLETYTRPQPGGGLLPGPEYDVIVSRISSLALAVAKARKAADDAFVRFELDAADARRGAAGAPLERRERPA